MNHKIIINKTKFDGSNFISNMMSHWINISKYVYRKLFVLFPFCLLFKVVWMLVLT
jgi:hypothetical protein